MKALVMGGTMFNGLALVRDLCANGHDVTIVNRGRTVAELPPGVERLWCAIAPMPTPCARCSVGSSSTASTT